MHKIAHKQWHYLQDHFPENVQFIQIASELFLFSANTFITIKSTTQHWPWCQTNILGGEGDKSSIIEQGGIGNRQ